MSRSPHSHKRTNIARFYLYEGSRLIKFLKTVEWWLPEITGQRDVELVLNMYRVAIWDDEQVPEMESGSVAQHCDYI